MPANDVSTPGWACADGRRGISDILWSCLATIFLCVWTAIHLSVPYYREQQSLSLRQRLVRSGIGSALICLIAPEFLAMAAIGELTVSWLGRKEIQPLTQIEWTLTHQFFLDMGGVCLRSPSGRHLQIGRSEVVRAMKASRSDGQQRIDASDWVSELEKLTEDQIGDLAKSDMLSKLIACGQALWLVAQVVSRLCQHQAVTLLEISTCAYVSCALLSYAAWWKKPQGCTSPVMITCSDDAMPKIVDRSFRGYYYYYQGMFKDFSWEGCNWLKPIDISRNDFGNLTFYLFMGLTGICPTIFGAIHVASWNVRLPSGVELWMWRASSIYCLIAGIAIAMIMLPLGYKKLSLWYDDFMGWSLYVLAAFYIIIRVYMMVEVFLSLRALPPSAFKSVQWLSFLPHV